MSLVGKVAVVTGASAGIGRVIALSLANAGVKVGLGARRLDLLEDLAAEIRENGGRAVCTKTDVVDRQQVKNLVAETEKCLGPVDILINNAAYYNVTPVTSLMEDAWEELIDTNCKGVMNGIGAVLCGMVRRRSGHIVNISSISGRKAFPGKAVYCGTKFFVEGMSQALRTEVAQHGIRVISIQPGHVNTHGPGPTVRKVDDGKYDWDTTCALKAQDVADAVIYALSRPPNVLISEVSVQPLP